MLNRGSIHGPFASYFCMRDWDAEIVSETLLAGYSQAYLEGEREDRMLGVPDVDGQLVAIALRLHIMPCGGLAALLALCEDTPTVLSGDIHYTFLPL